METSIIVSILLGFLKLHLGVEDDPAVYRRLRKQVCCWEVCIVALPFSPSTVRDFFREEVDETLTAFKVWLGTATGLAICIIIGCALIGVFYSLGKNRWSNAESVWEGIFALLASIIITLMGAVLLRISKLQAKWRVRLTKALEAKDGAFRTFSSRFKRWCERYAMFILPFVTVLREGLEAVVFIGGVSLGVPASSIPIPTIMGIIGGSLIGLVIYK